jgi:hypothetical protein
MKFEVAIKYNGWQYSVTVELIWYDTRIERFSASISNKTIILQSNRPLLRNKNLKKRRPNWTLVEGKVKSSSAVEDIQAQITKLMDSKWPDSEPKGLK